MTLRLHNTLTRQEETFEPLDRNHVRFYVCGPTALVETAARMLVELGHEPARVKTERFGPTG